MASTVSAVSAQEDAFWWQGSVMTIKARAEETGGAFGLVEGEFPRGFSPPLHVHTREDEGFYVVEGRVRFRQGEDEFVAGPGTWIWGRRGVPHTFRIESESARALVLVAPGGFERMFEEGGVRVSESAEPPRGAYDPEAARALAERFGFEVVGPQLA